MSDPTRSVKATDGFAIDINKSDHTISRLRPEVKPIPVAAAI